MSTPPSYPPHSAFSSRLFFCSRFQYLQCLVSLLTIKPPPSNLFSDCFRISLSHLVTNFEKTASYWTHSLHQCKGSVLKVDGPFTTEHWGKEVIGHSPDNWSIYHPKGPWMAMIMYEKKRNSNITIIEDQLFTTGISPPIRLDVNSDLPTYPIEDLAPFSL